MRSRTNTESPGLIEKLPHRRINEVFGLIIEACSRVGELFRRVIATCRSERVELQPACRGDAGHSPRPVAAGPLPGRIAQVVSH